MKAKSLPNSVDVGWRRYAIREWHTPEAVSNGRYGECSHMTAEIRIDTAHDDELVGAVLLHEITHSILRVFLTNGEGPPTEEQVVTALENGLASVFKANPDVILWILARFCPELMEKLAPGLQPVFGSVEDVG